MHSGGEFSISVTLGARAADIAENPRGEVVPRVPVLGDEKAGPEHEHGAAVLAGKPEGEPGRGAARSGDSPVAADSSGAGGAGWTGIAAAAGAGAVVVLIAGLALVRSRRRSATETTRGSA
ncbi:hypothetical protein [Streptomyces sp. LN785]|uniref:hypothetical protein n=1 Tax=Streptomyces sp. LN785 TaxID=3112983 RepID=UPI003717392C